MATITARTSTAWPLLKAPGGAAAVWASSGFTVPTDQDKLDEEMVRTLYERSGITLGRAIHLPKRQSLTRMSAERGYFWAIRRWSTISRDECRLGTLASGRRLTWITRRPEASVPRPSVFGD